MCQHVSFMFQVINISKAVTIKKTVENSRQKKNVERIPYMEIQRTFLNSGEYKNIYFKLYQYKVKYLQ